MDAGLDVPSARPRAYRGVAGPDITETWRVTPRSMSSAHESGDGHALGLDAALRLAAYRRARRRATGLLHQLIGGLRRSRHDCGDHLVRADQLPRCQSEAHLS